MSKIKFEDGIALEAQYLNESTTRIQKQITDSFLDTHTKGIIASKSPETIVYTDEATLGIFGVTAYDSFGNHIYIPKTGIDPENNPIPTISGLLPDETGKLIHGGIPITPQTANLLVVRYATVEGEPIAHKADDGTPFLMGVDDSYELYLRPLNATLEGDVILAKITCDSNGKLSVDESVKEISHVSKGSVIAERVTVNTDTTNTITKDYGTDISFESHINAVGTGEVSYKNPHGLSAEDIGIDPSATANHQKLLHVTGLRSDNIDSTVSAMYPSYMRVYPENEDNVIIQPLSDSLNEMLVVNGVSVLPVTFPAMYSFSFGSLNQPHNIGYYLFYYNVDTSRIENAGPFPSEEDEAFVQLLNTASYFPVCSLKWDEVSYDFTGDGLANTVGYDIIPATFKDRRVFNNTSLKNFRPDDAFALSQFAPIANDTAYIHNVRLMSGRNYPKYNVSGKNLSITVDDVQVVVQFHGENPIPMESIVDQIRTSMVAVKDGVSYLRAYPRIVTEDSTHPENVGKLSISAPGSLKINLIGNDTDAAADFGFTEANKNVEATSNGIIKEMLYYGARNGIIIFSYNDNELVTQIDYFLGGGKVRRNKFHYTGDYITRVEEIVEAL